MSREKYVERKKLEFHPKIFILDTRHGIYYYSIPTYDEQERIAVALLRRAKALNQIDYGTPPTEPEKIAPEVFQNLPESAKKLLKAVIADYQYNLNRYKDIVAQAEEINRAIEGVPLEGDQIASDVAMCFFGGELKIAYFSNLQ